MAVGPGVDVAFSSPTPIGHMDRVWWAGVAYSPKAPEWLVGVWTPWGAQQRAHNSGRTTAGAQQRGGERGAAEGGVEGAGGRAAGED